MKFIKYVLGFALIVALCLYSLIGFNFSINRYDEGISVYLASRVADGHIPYKDFWTVYSPAQFYCMALMFKIFGTSLLVERVWTILGFLFLSGSVFLVLRDFTSKTMAIMGAIFVLVWIEQLPINGYAMPWGIFFSMLSARFLLKFIAQKKLKLLFYCGLLNGATTLFRHDVGYYNLIAGMCILFWFSFRTPPEVRKSIAVDSKNIVLKALQCYGLGMAIIILPVAVYFLSTVPFKELFFDLIQCPLTITPKVSYLRYPGLFSGFTDLSALKSPMFYYCVAGLYNFNYYFPFLAGGLAVLFLILDASKKNLHRDNTKVWAIFYFLLLSFLYFNQVAVRSDLTHLLLVMVPAAILFFLSFERFGKYYWACAAFPWGLMVAMLFLPVTQKLLDFVLMRHLQATYEFKLERAKNIFVSPKDKYYEEVVQYIQQVVPEGERIYVGQKRHDRIFIEDVMFYFLANRHSATRYHGWLKTTEPVQKEIIKDIEQCHVNYIVLREDQMIVSEPNETAKSSGVKLLDEYIDKNFSLEKRIMNYFILKRKS